MLPRTGERLVTDAWDDVALEHIHRYAMCMEYCKDKVVLDVASGEGYGSWLLSTVARSVVGVDVSGEAVQHSAEKYRRSNLRFLEGTATDLPLAKGSVDVVVSFETIEHHNRHEEMLSEIKRSLRPGGLLVMSSPDKKFYSDEPGYANPYHVKELYSDEFRVLVQRYFRNVQMLGQRSLFASFVVPDGITDRVISFGGGFGEVWRREGLGRARYQICLASDDVVPVGAISYYEGDNLVRDMRSAMSEWREVTRERDAIKTVLGDLQKSWSYRIGRSVTWPIRKLSR